MPGKAKKYFLIRHWLIAVVLLMFSAQNLAITAGFCPMMNMHMSGMAGTSNHHHSMRAQHEYSATPALDSSAISPCCKISGHCSSGSCSTGYLIDSRYFTWQKYSSSEFIVIQSYPLVNDPTPPFRPPINV